MPSTVRPEFGPTLPAIGGPKWHAMGRAPRAAIIVAGLFVVAVAAFLLTGGASPLRTVEVAAPVPFHLEYNPSSLQQLVAVRPQSLRLASPNRVQLGQTVTVQPLHLAPYSGSIGGVLPLTAARLTQQMSRADRSFAVRTEGSVVLNDQPGYEITFQTAVRGMVVFGRRVLLFPAQPGARAGIDVLMTAFQGPAAPIPNSVGERAPLRDVYQSLSVGG